MVQAKEQSKRVIEIIPEELDDFESKVKRFQAGEWNEADFMAFRLRQGVYGQRQPDVHMVRIKIPFGGVTADQLDLVGDVADEYASLKKGHATTRECIQIHNVPLADTPDILRKLASVGLTTREAAGNSVRNVTGCAMAGVCGDERFDVTPYAAAYSRYFVRHPCTQAMPRKIKTAFSGCEGDCAITAIHDIGFIAKVADGKRGFKMVAGGGTSIMPRLAPTLYEFVPVEEYLRRAEAVIRVFQQSDELRRNRMKARIKFLIDRIGIDEFRDMVEEELKQPWARRSFDPTPLLFLEDESVDAPPLEAGYAAPNDTPEYRQWLDSNVSPQKQEGYVAVTVRLPLGDIQSEQFHALADVARQYAGARARLTAQQNLTFRWVPENALPEVWERLNEMGLGQPGAHEIGDVVSCPGTDSCKLGITSSMGLARAIIETINGIDTSDPLIKQMRIKMSGCPNGCSHHHVADIGFHGAAAKAPGGQVPAYDMFVGGSYGNGDTRFGQRVKVKVPAKRMPEALTKVLDFYKAQRRDGEEFKDFVARLGPEAFEPILDKFKDVPSLDRDTLVYYMDWSKTVKYVLERGEGECAV